MWLCAAHNISFFLNQFRQNTYFPFQLSKKGINSNRLHRIDTRLMHMYKLGSVYKSYGSCKLSGVTWGHRGQKVIFTKKASSPTKLRSIDARLIYMYKLDHLYKNYGSTKSSRVIYIVVAVLLVKKKRKRKRDPYLQEQHWTNFFH